MSASGWRRKEWATLAFGSRLNIYSRLLTVRKTMSCMKTPHDCGRGGIGGILASGTAVPGRLCAITFLAVNNGPRACKHAPYSPAISASVAAAGSGGMNGD